MRMPDFVYVQAQSSPKAREIEVPIVEATACVASPLLLFLYAQVTLHLMHLKIAEEEEISYSNISPMLGPWRPLVSAVSC
jgi:hypothetical protein